MLHMAYYFQSRTITFLDLSLREAPNFAVDTTPACETGNVISKLLNKQIKSAMKLLLERIASEVLEDLEKLLKTKDRTVWPSCFCAISLLCICIEETQISIDGFAMYNTVYAAAGAHSSMMKSVEACEKLDSHPFRHLLDLFHGIFRSKKAHCSQGNGKVYNPIRDKLGNNIESTMDTSAINLVHDMREFVSNNGNEIMRPSGIIY